MLDGELVFDIGANNGDDTAFYLAKGFRVVAVEANPRMVSVLTERFATSDVVVEAVAVSDTAGRRPFYANEMTLWSSLERDSKATTTHTHEVTEVPCTTLSDLMDRHGVPYYLKIDIEGGEESALRGMGEGPFPPYVSIEVNRAWQTCLDLLVSHGYSDFQLVLQGAGRALPPPPRPALEGRDVDVTFGHTMSGTFGRELCGAWISIDALRIEIEEELVARERRIERGDRPGWADVHARLRMS